MAELSPLMSEGRNDGSREKIRPPRPIPMKLKSFLSAVIWRMNLTSVPKSVVCLPLIQVKPSRNSGTGTLRDCVADPRYGLEILGLNETELGNVGAWRVGKFAICLTRPAETWLIKFAVGVHVQPREKDRKSTRLNSSHSQISYA